VGLTLPGAHALGRFDKPAGLILVALGGGPRTLVGLFDGVRSINGPIGPGTLVAALARLEQLRLVEAAPGGHRRRAYRLTGEVVHG
jgi:DNA-binding PadR family transcriptional regulator